MTWTKENLITFEQRVEQSFLNKEIRSPIHLSGGNEEELLAIFQSIRQQDWVLSGWRSHYHALLKGIPAEEVFQQILSGKSMYLSSKEHKFLCSSIVGGILPIAAGLALAAKLKGLDEKVWVFVGDMTASTGVFYEFGLFCQQRELLVQIVCEDNGMSTNTPTREAWGHGTTPTPLIHYTYQRIYPHVGCGRHVQF